MLVFNAMFVREQNAKWIAAHLLYHNTILYYTILNYTSEDGPKTPLGLRISSIDNISMEQKLERDARRFWGCTFTMVMLSQAYFPKWHLLFEIQ